MRCRLQTIRDYERETVNRLPEGLRGIADDMKAVFPLCEQVQSIRVSPVS